jgi:protein-S-isoprenylcysteine O-methyltransferase Ste14
VPVAFFGWLAYLQALRLISDVRLLPKPLTAPALLGGPLPVVLYLAFCLIPVGIYVGRPVARERDGRLVPRALALVGTLMVLVVGALPQGALLYTPPVWVHGLSTGLSLLAFIVIIAALLFLRRSLSIFPEARRLVVDGPYRVIRHPLYAAELLAMLAFALVTPTGPVVVILAPFIATQVLRSRFEERLLTRVFPTYRAYTSRTHRLIPFVW